MTARLRFRGEDLEVQVLDLEEDVRAGRVPGIAEVLHPPWTGERWTRIEDVAELSDALDGAGARLSAHLRTGPWPWASMALTLFILGCGVLQGFATLFTPLLGVAGLEIRDFFLQGMTGLDAMIFEGRGSTAFTSQLTHGGAQHLFPNLAVIGYAGFRVERAAGAGGFAVIAVASVVTGTVAIALLESVPVLGSSVLGYGLWAAMLALGLRLGDHLPPRDRRFYGYGAIALFLVLVAGTLGQEGVSHTGHGFGFLGGALASFGVRPESVVPRSRKRWQARVNLGAALLLACVPWVVANTLYRFPTLLLGSAVPVQVDGWKLGVPAEMAERRATLAGAQAWTTSESSREGVFASVAQTGERTPEDLETVWARRSDGPLEILSPPTALGPDWVAWRGRLTRADGRPLAEVVEHRRVEGHTRWRLGMLVQVGHDGALGRRAPTLQAILDSAVPQEADDTRVARQGHEAGGGPRTQLAWAEQLHALGRLADADAALAALVASPRVAADASKARFRLWEAHPDQVPPDAVAQVETALSGQASDWRLMSTGVRWLLAHSACPEAHATTAALGQVWGDSQAYARLAAEVSEGCPVAP